jgi:hypothetical protein
MRLSHDPMKISARFDDPNLVSRAGLVPVMSLAGRAGLHGLVRRHVRIESRAGVYPDLKVACLVAGMAAGAGSTGGMDLLRHGAMPELFAGVRSPSTLGSFLRSFTFGNVRQLEKAGRELLAELACRAPLLPGAQTLAFVDFDSAAAGLRAQEAGRGVRAYQDPGQDRAGPRAERAGGDHRYAAVSSGGRCHEAARRQRELRPRRRVVHRRGAGHGTGGRVHRHDRGAGRLGVLLRGVHRRLPPRRGVLLGHRPDGPRGQARHRHDRRRRVDAHQVPPRDLG